MLTSISAVRNTLLNLAFPRKCHTCASRVDDDRHGVACRSCWEKTSLFVANDHLCPKCGAKSSANIEVFACRQCESHHYDSARSLGVYEWALSANILNLKRFPSIPQYISELIPAGLAYVGENCDLVIPVPLSSKRLSERGFNQADLVAAKVSMVLGVPVDLHSLTRTVHSPMHRASMDRKAREMSVRNAFKVVRPRMTYGRSILLVDDILTSGATVSNCAKALKNSGAKKVNVFTLARTASS